MTGQGKLYFGIIAQVLQHIFTLTVQAVQYVLNPKSRKFQTHFPCLGHPKSHSVDFSELNGAIFVEFRSCVEEI